MKKTYDVLFANNKDSNEFLRCLWHRIRVHFGKLAWCIAPSKIGEQNTIHIGFADMGDLTEKHEPTSISCTYSKKGCLKSIAWDNEELLEPDDFEAKFSKSISEARNFREYKESRFLGFYLDKNISFNECRGKHFSIKGNKLHFKIDGYDKKDIETFAQSATRMLRSLLTYDTLIHISSSNSGIEDLRTAGERDVVLEDWRTNEILTEYNTNAKYRGLKISDKMMNYIDEFLAKDISYESPYNNFEKSVLSFSQAIFFEEMDESNFYLDFSPSEYATICYMSALEIISINDIAPSKCSTCGQDIYSISKRVKQLAENAISNNNAIKSYISRYYSARSKFVHVGEYMSTNNYIGTSIPLLSPGGVHGIIDQHFRFDSSMKEIVKECIQWHENVITKKIAN